MSQALSFNEVSLVPVPVTNSPFTWLRSADIARALGYKRVDILSKLYNNNADEFTPEMTQVIEIVAEHQNGVAENLSDGRCRIFSLRGCHLLAMFSRTPVAKAFRKWVLDVLDRLAEEEQAALPHGDTLTAAEQATILTPSTADDRKPLRSLVHAWAQIAGKSHTALWPQVKAHFQLTRIDDLPVEWIPDALAFVQGKIDTTDRALPPATQPALPAATENTEFLPTMFPTFEKDILEIERLIERLCNGMSIFARPGSMMYSELVRNKQLIDAVQPCISAAKNAVGTGYFMMQTARKVYGAMR